MKRSLALLLASGLTTITALLVIVTMISAVIGSVETTEADLADQVTVGEDSDEQAWRLNVEATAQTINQRIESTIRDRESGWQAQVARRQQALSDLDNASQAQIVQTQAHLEELQTRIEQSKANHESLQAHTAALQQVIDEDEATYQHELETIIKAGQQLDQSLEAALAQLNAVYTELAQRQTGGQPDAAISSGGGSHDDDDDDDDHQGDHEDDDDDDDDDHEESGEDDDDDEEDD